MSLRIYRFNLFRWPRNIRMRLNLSGRPMPTGSFLEDGDGLAHSHRLSTKRGRNGDPTGGMEGSENDRRIPIGRRDQSSPLPSDPLPLQEIADDRVAVGVRSQVLTLKADGESAVCFGRARSRRHPHERPSGGRDT